MQTCILTYRHAYIQLMHMSMHMYICIRVCIIHAYTHGFRKCPGANITLTLGALVVRIGDSGSATRSSKERSKYMTSAYWLILL